MATKIRRSGSKKVLFKEALSGLVHNLLQDVYKQTEWNECSKKRNGVKKAPIAANGLRGYLGQLISFIL